MLSRLSFLLVVLLLPWSLFAQSADEATIRTLRAQSNRAIMERNLTAFGQTMLPEIEVTRGSGSHVSGRDSVLASVAPQFNDPNFLGYVRHTDSLQISSSAPLAAEHGHWTGRFKRADGIQTLTGVYLAMWCKTDVGWRIRSELFVVLTCTGSVECGR